MVKVYPAPTNNSDRLQKTKFRKTANPKDERKLLFAQHFKRDNLNFMTLPPGPLLNLDLCM